MGEGKAAVDKADKAVDQVLVLAAHKVVEGLVLAADKAAG